MAWKYLLTAEDVMGWPGADPMPLDQLERRSELVTPRQAYDYLRTQEAWWGDDLVHVAQCAFVMLRVRSELESGVREGERQPRGTGLRSPNRPLAPVQQPPVVRHWLLTRIRNVLPIALGFCGGVLLLVVPALIDRFVRAAIGG